MKLVGVSMVRNEADVIDPPCHLFTFRVYVVIPLFKFSIALVHRSLL